jgi:hypothetical protein
LGGETLIDIDDRMVLSYQESRLRENAAPKSINEEVRFLLKMLGDPGDVKLLTSPPVPMKVWSKA